jgi:hypothetical protein
MQQSKNITWIPSDTAQAFNTSGSTAITATREELKLSPASKTNILKICMDDLVVNKK